MELEPLPKTQKKRDKLAKKRAKHVEKVLSTKKKNEDGWLYMDTWTNDEESYPEMCITLADPLPFWPLGNYGLGKKTMPREIWMEQDKLKNLTKEQFESYCRTIKYWKSVWFAYTFLHFHQECRTSETICQADDQDFWRAPPLSMPIRADVLNFDWEPFIESHKRLAGQMFDVIVTDPPWTLATEKSTRGVALNYDQITDSRLMAAVPFERLINDNGVIFMWVINAKMLWATDWLTSKGFRVIDLITWLKMSTNRLLARGHGFYLQHAKEDCIVAVKGDVSKFNWKKMVPNFLAQKRCQSQKPSEFYDMCEAIVPEGNYLEVFGRRNNLRNGWVTIGNQL